MDITAELSANVWKILVAPGDEVDAGQTLMILEAMKMEIPVPAESAGTVIAIHVAENDVVVEDQVLATVE